MKLKKTREMGDVLSDSFLFIKNEFKPLGRLSLIYVLPFFIVFAYVQVLLQQKMVGITNTGNPEEIFANLRPLYSSVFISWGFSVFVQALFMGVIYSYIEAYVNKGKGNFTLQDITGNLFSNTLLILGTVIVMVIVSMLGFILCFLPGIYLANTFSVAGIISVMEKKGISHAFSRSWKLVNSQWFNTFGINLLGLIIIMVMGFILAIPTMVTGFSNSFFNTLQGEPVDYPQWYWIMIGVTTVISSFFYIIPYVFIAFQYFNLDEHTKNRDVFP